MQDSGRTERFWNPVVRKCRSTPAFRTRNTSRRYGCGFGIHRRPPSAQGQSFVALFCTFALLGWGRGSSAQAKWWIQPSHVMWVRGGLVAMTMTNCDPTTTWPIRTPSLWMHRGLGWTCNPENRRIGRMSPSKKRNFDYLANGILSYNLSSLE